MIQMWGVLLGNSRHHYHWDVTFDNLFGLSVCLIVTLLYYDTSLKTNKPFKGLQGKGTSKLKIIGKNANNVLKSPSYDF